jgi:nitroimidazol reductase NimA-like FMN-containing flavoprotein (pyridoxamine 5'-phosphate oxidase superfamily)
LKNRRDYMFRESRLEKFKMPKDEAERLLRDGSYGVLSTWGEDGYPYGAPVNHVYIGGKIYFHGAGIGHKADNISFCHKVSFCVVGTAEEVPEKFTTNYDSVIVFGSVSRVYGEEAALALTEIVKKYCADYLEKGLAVIKSHHKAAVYKIEPEHISGKHKRMD